MLSIQFDDMTGDMRCETWGEDNQSISVDDLDRTIEELQRAKSARQLWEALQDQQIVAIKNQVLRAAEESEAWLKSVNPAPIEVERNENWRQGYYDGAIFILQKIYAVLDQKPSDLWEYPY